MVAAALAVRVVYVVGLTQHRDLGFDAAYFDLLALSLREGRGFVDPYALYFRGRTMPTALFPPAYPIVLAGASYVTGSSTKLGHLLVGAALGAVTVALVGLLARRLAGPAAGLAAAALSAVHPMLVGADGSLMSEALYAPLVVGALLLALRLRAGDARRWELVALGAVIGVAGLTRGEGLVLLPLLGIPAAWRATRSPRARAAAIATVVIVPVLVLVPWAARNASVFDEPVLLASNSATVVGGANCGSTYDGPRLGFWDAACLRADRPESIELDESELNNEIRREGLAYARHHLGRLPVVAVARLARTWGLFHPLGQMRFEAGEGRVFGVQVAGWMLDLLLVPLAVGGAIALRRRGGDVAPLLVVPVLVSVVSIGTYGNQRFRLAAEPVVIVLAVAAVTAFVQQRRQAGGSSNVSAS